MEVCFGSKLHENVVEFLTRGARHVEFTALFSILMSEDMIRTIDAFLMSKGLREMEEDPKTPQVNIKRHISHTMTLALWLIRVVLIQAAPVIVTWRSQAVPTC